MKYRGYHIEPCRGGFAMTRENKRTGRPMAGTRRQTVAEARKDVDAFIRAEMSDPLEMRES